MWPRAVAARWRDGVRPAARRLLLLCLATERFGDAPAGPNPRFQSSIHETCKAMSTKIRHKASSKNMSYAYIPRAIHTVPTHAEIIPCKEDPAMVWVGMPCCQGIMVLGELSRAKDVPSALCVRIIQPVPAKGLSHHSTRTKPLHLQSGLGLGLGLALSRSTSLWTAVWSWMSKRLESGPYPTRMASPSSVVPSIASHWIPSGVSLML